MEIGVTIHILKRLTEDNTLDHDRTRHAFNLKHTQTHTNPTVASFTLPSVTKKPSSSSNHEKKKEYHVLFSSLNNSINHADRSHQIKKDSMYNILHKSGRI